MNRVILMHLIRRRKHRYHSERMKVYIYYNCSWEDVRRIEDRFGFPHCVTVNGETCQPVKVKPEDWSLLQETEKRGFIQIRRKK